MSKRLIIISGATIFFTIFSFVAYLSFNFLGITQAEVKRYEITIATESDTKIYDGTPLTNSNWTIEAGRLEGFDTLEVTMNSTITFPGSVENKVGVTISDENGKIVTNNYRVNLILGSLTVTPIDLTFQTETKSKTFDGTPLTSSFWNLSYGQLLAGDHLEATMQSSITNPGTISNGLDIIIYNEQNENVTRAYNIEYLLGDLTIMPIYLTISTESASKIYDGLPLSLSQWHLESGLLDSNHHLDVTMGSSITTPGSIDNDIRVQILNSSNQDVSTGYEIIYDLGLLTVESRPLVIETESLTKTYDSLPLTSTNWTLSSGALMNGQQIIAEMTTSITLPGVVDNLIVVTILDSNNENVTNNYDIELLLGQLTVLGIPITVSTESQNKVYDGLPLSNSNYQMISGTLLAGDTLSAVMNSSLIMPDTIDNEVIISITNASNMDVTHFYEITYLLGELTVLPRDFTITTESLDKPYDGFPLTSTVWNLLNGTLVDGDRIEAVMNSTITNPGEIDNEVLITIYDALNQVVTDSYNIDYQLGTLVIHAIELMISTETLTKAYDGLPLSSEIYTLESGTLLEGHYIVPIMNSSITLPGHTDNTIGVTVLNDLGTNVTSFYHINTTLGTLTVNGLNITIETETKTKTYDGLPLTSDVYNIVSGSLLPTHTLTPVMNASITNAGMTSNTINVTILDELGQNVTNIYDITYQKGNLIVEKVSITVDTLGAEKPYDGTPLTNENYVLSSGALLGLDHISAVFSASITYPGSTPNTIGVTVLDEFGNDVSNNYNVRTNLGTLRIYGIPLAILTGTDSKFYNGTPLTYPVYQITAGQVLPVHTLEYVMASTITYPGTVDNLIGITIYDASHGDVTNMYEITYTYGTLTVDPISLDLSSASDSKVYDGTPLTNGTWVLENGTLLSTHTLHVIVNGTITAVGDVPNTINAYVTDSNLNDVSDYYEFVYLTGTLSVLSSVYGTGDIATDPFDIPLYDVLNIYSTKTEHIYFKDKSYGDYIYSGFETGTVQNTQITTNPARFTSLALTTTSRVSTILQVEYLKEQTPYLLPYYTVDPISGTNDIHTYGSVTGTVNYNYISYNYDPADSISVPLANTSDELVYRNYVYSNYLGLPQDTYLAMLNIIFQNGINPNSPTIITDVQNYIQHAATYNLNFSSIPTGSDIAIYFLTVSKEGICQHFATAATVMYRALGIPARYTVGYLGASQANQWTVVTSEYAHAWVEVYIDSMGWVPIEVTGSGVSEPINPLIPITVSPNPVKQLYTPGVTITPTTLKMTGFNDYLLAGYTFTATYNGSLSTPGKVDSSVASLIIYDPTHVDVTDQFEITYQNSYLQLYQYAVDLYTDGGVKEYDSYPLTVNTWHVTGTFGSGDSLEILSFLGTQTNVGLSINKALFRVIDSLGNDISELYSVTPHYGTLEVTTTAITIESGSSYKSYDGLPLVNNTYFISSGALGDLDTLEVVISGEQTSIGVSENFIDSVLIIRNGIDVTFNYVIEVINGELMVTP